jgi:hypothetical protein
MYRIEASGRERWMGFVKGSNAGFFGELEIRQVFRQKFQRGLIAGNWPHREKQRRCKRINAVFCLPMAVAAPLRRRWAAYKNPKQLVFGRLGGF